jgi:hypothetical protein
LTKQGVDAADGRLGFMIQTNISLALKEFMLYSTLDWPIEVEVELLARLAVSM